jgi:hypothetical protein
MSAKHVRFNAVNHDDSGSVSPGFVEEKNQSVIIEALMKRRTCDEKWFSLKNQSLLF